MKRLLAILLILTLTLSFAACAGQNGENAGNAGETPDAVKTLEPVKLSESFFITVENGSDDEIYGISCDYKLGSTVVETHGGMNDDNAPIAKGDVISFEVTPDTFGADVDVSTFCADIYVIRQDGTAVEAGGIAPIVAGGESYAFILTGDAGAGYIIDMK